MNLKHLTDKALLTDTMYLVTREREFLTKILHHLKEIDHRRLYSDLGYKSLYEYCIRELGYSEGNAHRRITACRLLADLPELERKIEEGTLTLSNIAQANHFFNKNDVERLEDKKVVLEQLENLSKNEAEKMLHIIAGEPELPKPKELLRRTSAETTRLSVVFNDGTLERCEQLKSLIGRAFTFEQLVEYMVEKCIGDLEKNKFKSSSIKKSPPPVEVKRVINSSVKGEVYRRDKRCTICGSQHNLQFDHRTPFALGGKSDSDNIRLLCFNCNQRSRIRAGLTSPSSS